jgi:hypothetical protein
MTNGYRLKTRLPNGAEFEAEGSEETVRALFDTFLAAVRDSVTATPRQPEEPSTPPASTAPPSPLTDEYPGRVDASILNRLFVLAKDGSVTLRALPNTDNREGDSLLALLYGYQALKDDHAITGTELKKAARQSGVQIDRVDRVMAPYEGTWVTTAGFKKGRKYGLNNQGVRRAGAILTQIMG